jgi:hypothetical protein
MRTHIISSVRKKKKRPWGLLALLLAVYVHNQWSRYVDDQQYNTAV